MSAIEIKETVVNPRNILYNAKRFIGRDFQSVREEALGCSCDLVEGAKGSVQYRCPATQQLISAEEVRLCIRSLSEQHGKFRCCCLGLERGAEVSLSPSRTALAQICRACRSRLHLFSVTHVRRWVLGNFCSSPLRPEAESSNDRS